MKYKIAAGEFKAKCLNIMNKVEEAQAEYVITKRGRPVARLVPIEKAPPSRMLEELKGTVTIKGDIVAPMHEEWGVEK